MHSHHLASRKLHYKCFCFPERLLQEKLMLVITAQLPCFIQTRFPHRENIPLLLSGHKLKPSCLHYSSARPKSMLRNGSLLVPPGFEPKEYARSISPLKNLQERCLFTEMMLKEKLALLTKTCALMRGVGFFGQPCKFSIVPNTSQIASQLLNHPDRCTFSGYEVVT